MKEGIVIKALNSYYYIQSGDEENEITRCKIRGRFKKDRFSLCVGDRVKFTDEGTGDGTIEEIMARRSLLKRPLAANVDQVIITFAAKNPDLSALLIDRFIALSEYSNLSAVLCINKCDLADEARLDEFLARYKSIGYPVIKISALQETNISELKSVLKDKISVVTGPSGAGKSTLINAVEKTLSLETGEVSEKLGRGCHTTRVSKLLPLTGGGYIVDTPGFSFVEFNEMDKRELSGCFVEFAADKCRFSSCLHDKEAHCYVKECVAQGKIHKERYESYLHILNEINNRKRGF
jgi:ribosome biogenesis GTPase